MIRNKNNATGNPDDVFDWENEIGTEKSATATTAATAAKPGENELLNPTTGEVVSADDIDGLIDMLEGLRSRKDDISTAIVTAERFLVSRAPADDGPRTKRVKGRLRTVKIEHPGPSWDSGKLMEAWCAYPNICNDYLRIERIVPKMREVKKLRETGGEKDFEQFRSMVLGAEKPPAGKSRVSIEE